MIWQQLREATVRDLAWSCFGPPLLFSAELQGADPDIGNCSLALDQKRLAWLLQLDRDPDPLLEFLGDSPGGRLGIYFEKLWHFFLRQDPAIELLAHNLPVREDGQTLGEFDCIYFCKQRREAVHLELAVKFYLEVPGTDLWLGPGCRDHLQQKVERLLSHQIQLGRSGAGHRALQRLGLEQLSREIEIRGHLFAAGTSPRLPPGYNREQLLGGSQHWQDFLAGPAQNENWVILPRSGWLRSCNLQLQPDATYQAADVPAMEEHFSQRQSPLQLAACDSEGREVSRCFVTPDNWPKSLPDR